MITVYNPGGVAVPVMPDIAAEFGLRDGDAIDDETAWRVADLSAAALRALFEKKPRGAAATATFNRALDHVENLVARHYAKADAPR